MFLHKIALVAMILEAGFFAKIILLFLAVISIISWSIIITKIFQFKRHKYSLKRISRRFANIKDFIGASEKKALSVNTIAGRISLPAVQEFKRIKEDMEKAKKADNLAIFFPIQFNILQTTMEQVVAREVEQCDWGITVLAISTSVSPFIGLLGTVWGITHSFYDIGSMGSTSINIVAPGIAEALVTTIFGLVVAIPCSIFYNYFIKELRVLETKMIDFASFLISDIKSVLINGEITEK